MKKNLPQLPPIPDNDYLFPVKQEEDNQENLQNSITPKQASKESSNEDLKQEIREAKKQEINQYSFQVTEQDLEQEGFESTNIEINKLINEAIEHLLYRNKMILKFGLKKKKDIINKALFDYLKKEFK